MVVQWSQNQQQSWPTHRAIVALVAQFTQEIVMKNSEAEMILEYI